MQDRRRVQRDPAATRGRHAARRHVRRRRVRARRAAQGPDARRARARWSSAAAASARPSRPRWPRPGVAAIGAVRRQRRRGRGAGRAAADALPGAEVATGSKDPAGYDIVVNATPLGMNDGDPLPIDVTRIAPTTFVGEVVMKQEITPLPARGAGKGCRPRSAPTCCSSRSRPTWSSSGSARRLPRSCAASRQLQY